MKKLLLITVLLIVFSVLTMPAFAAEAPRITQQPADLTVDCGSILSLTVQASGSSLSYQWYKRESPSAAWVQWRNMTSPVIYVYAAAELDGQQVRCVIFNSAGSVTSRTAAITIAPSISSHTADITCELGETVTLSVSAGGKDLRYQWYTLAKGSSAWEKWEGMTQSSVTLTVEEKHDGMRFDCRITASNGLTISSYYAESYTRWRTRITVAKPQTPVPTTEVTLYCLSEAYQAYLTIPASVRQQHSLPGHTLTVKSGESVEIVNGVIRPKLKTTYSYQLPESGYWVTSDAPTGQPGEVVRHEYTLEDSVIRVDGTEELIVHVKSYAEKYAVDTMDAYLRQHIRESMNEYQKAEECCKFVAGYNYSPDYSSATGMIVTGGGDCWSSTGALSYMLDQLGIHSKSRYAGYMAGAGSGHYNVIAKLDGLYYILETGYVGTAPRMYTMSANASPFKWSTYSGEVTITDYNNIDGASVLTVPAAIEGKPVTAIGSRAFQSEDFTRVILPSTIKTIGEEAFYDNELLESINFPSGLTSIGVDAFCYCRSLTSVSLPSSVEEIGTGAFLYCSRLQSISVNSANGHFKSVGGVLFRKDMKNLVTFPCGKRGSYTVPEGVTEITAFAFANASLDTVTLPSTLVSMGKYAFYLMNCDNLIFTNGLTDITEHAFQSLQADYIELPESLKTIGSYAFKSSHFKSIALPAGLETVGDYAFAGNLSLTRVQIPASVTRIGAYAFAIDYGWSSMGGSTEPQDMDGYILFERGMNCQIDDTAFSDVVLGVWSGSQVHAWAQAHEVPFMLLDGGNVLQDAWFQPLSASSYIITDTPCTPEISLVSNAAPVSLNPGCDYRVEYHNNDRPGTATAAIIGIGGFTGTVTRTFTVKTYEYYLLMDTCGGTRPNSMSTWHIDNSIYVYKDVTYGQPYGTLPLSTRAGYVFDGWYTAPKGGDRVTESTLALNTDTSEYKVFIYAHWKAGDLNGDGRADTDDDLLDLFGSAPARVYRLPAAMTAIEAGAFTDTPAQVVYVPGTVHSIAYGAFDPDTVIVLADAALQNQLEAQGYTVLIAR